MYLHKYVVEGDTYYLVSDTSSKPAGSRTVRLEDWKGYATGTNVSNALKYISEATFSREEEAPVEEEKKTEKSAFSDYYTKKIDEVKDRLREMKLELIKEKKKQFAERDVERIKSLEKGIEETTVLLNEMESWLSGFKKLHEKAIDIAKEMGFFEITGKVARVSDSLRSMAKDLLKGQE